MSDYSSWRGEPTELDDLRAQALRSFGLPATPEEHDAYIDSVMAQRERAAAEQNPFDKLTTEEIQAAFYRASVSEQEQERHRIEGDAAQSFMSATPDFIANPKNGYQLQRELEAQGLPVTVANLTSAWEKLKQLGLVEYDQEAVEAEAKEVRKQVIQKRAALTAKRIMHVEQPNPDDPRNLSMDELRARAINSYQGGE
jgi:hypothetical protein